MASKPGIVALAIIVVALAACSSGSPQSTKPQAHHYGDITLTSCAQDPGDNTSIIAKGTISSAYAVPYDYSFSITSYNGTTPAGGTGVTEHSVEPGAVLPWSVQMSIAGSTSGTYTCRLWRILRTPSRS